MEFEWKCCCSTVRAADGRQSAGIEAALRSIIVSEMCLVTTASLRISRATCSRRRGAEEPVRAELVVVGGHVGVQDARQRTLGSRQRTLSYMTYDIVVCYMYKLAKRN